MMLVVVAIARQTPLARLLRMAYPGLLAAGVLLGDACISKAKPGLVIAGAIDESAHIATTLLLGGPGIRRVGNLEKTGAGLGSIMIDLDHVPLVLLKRPLVSAEDRPVTHSLVTLMVLMLSAQTATGRRRRMLHSVAAGTVSHFVRDMATGGVRLGWPVNRRLIRVPYAAYAALLIVSAIQTTLAHGNYSVTEDSNL